jgi:sn-glycerol 3-phosphate transport system substrate-binding protein
LGALTLVACSGPSTAPKPSSSALSGLDFSGVKPAKTIDYWTVHPASSVAVETQLVNAFNSSQSDVQVNMVTAGANYEDVASKFQTAQAARKLPGVVMLSDVWWFRYYLNQSIIPLDSLLKHLTVDTGDYVSTLYRDYNYNGAHWAVPYARSTLLFYYNKTAWSNAGLPDRGPKTWDEFGGWAKKLMSSNTGSMTSAFEFNSPTDYPAWEDQNNFWAYGGEYSDKFTIDCNSAKSVAALERIRDAIYKDKWAVVSSSSAVSDLGAGATAATRNSSGNLVSLQKTARGKFDVGVAFLPGGSAGTTNVCPTGGAGLSIPAGITPEQQVAAGMFLKFMTSPENTVIFSAATGYLPVRKSADTKVLLTKTPLIETAIKQLATTRSQDWARVFLPTGDDILANAIVAVTTQNADPKASLTAAKTQLEQAYNTSVKPNLSK